ncbi:MAG TPA: response regulator transcription factor [Solirubrobacterales bacterium]|nr:response regulator transcription factor [Solirubrobacterales bacterium]
MIDAHPLVRLGVRGVLADAFEIHESESRDEALCLVRDVGSIDVAIVDLRRGAAEEAGDSLHGEEAIRALHRTAPGMGIVAHGERPERHLASAALQAGASAYVARTADAEEMTKAARAALDQGRFVDPAVPPSGSRGKLTRRQREILQLLADGDSTSAAARELGLSEETVKTHTKNMLARLGARNRTHAVAIALRECLID